MKKTLRYTCLLAVLTLSLWSCKDDTNSETYTVDITIVSPTNNSTIASGSDVHIHINFSNSDTDPTIHNIKVELLDADGGTVDVLTDEHIHDTDGYHEYHNMGYTLPAITGTYTLRASSTNMMGMGDNSVSHTLELQ